MREDGRDEAGPLRGAPGRIIRLVGLGLAIAGGAFLLAACDPPPPPHTFTVTSTADKVDALPGDGVCQTATPSECTLRAAIQEANAVAGDDTIELATSAYYSLSIAGAGEDAAATGDLDLTSNVTLHGHGSVISAQSVDHALQVRSGTVKIDQVTLRAAKGSGLDAVAGVTTVSDSTLSYDTIGVSTSGSASVSLTRSTVSAASTWGISNAGGQVLLLDSTIGANTAGGISTTAGTTSATNTIVGDQAGGPPCSASITSGGSNLDVGTTCGFTQPTDLQSSPALLGPLAVNGGPTATMRPMVGSAAVDSGQPGCTGADQRGAPRPTDGDGNGTAACDRGAVEVETWHPLTMTVNNTADLTDDIPGDGICHAADGSCTLRAAIQESGASTGPDVVNLATAATYQMSIYGGSEDAARTGDLDIASPLILHGNGSSVIGYNDGALQVHGRGVVIDHVAATGSLFGIDVRPRGSVALEDSTLSGNGQGLLVGTGAQVALTRSTVSSNFTDGINSAGATVTLLDSTIADNVRNVVSTSSSVTATNTIVADPTEGPNCSAGITSGGWNLSTDGTCGLNGATDVVTATGHLGPLATTNSKVPSRAPTSSSLAIDTGRPGCTGPDQRGRTRPTDGDGNGIAACDRGAVEAAPWHPMAFVVDSQNDWPDANPGDGLCASTSGGCTLRSAIQEANAASGPDTIDLGTGLQYTINGVYPDDDAGALGDFDVATDLTLHGHGSRLVANSSSVFQVFGATVSIDDLSSETSSSFVDNQFGSLSLTDVSARSRTANLSSGPGALTVVRSNLFATEAFGIQQSGIGPLTIRSSAVGGVNTSATQVTVGSSTVSVLYVRSGTATVTDSTLTSVNLVSGAAATVTNSIIDHGPNSGADCSGPVSSGGWNLTRDHSCNLTGPSDLQDVDPRLSPLGAHGGPTRTMIPLSGSAAVDSGKPGCTGTDQRGLARPTDGDGNGTTGCDRGAVELGTWQPLALTVTSANEGHDDTPGDGICSSTSGGGCTLRAAVEESTVASGPDTITIAVPSPSFSLHDPFLGNGYLSDLTIDTAVVIHGGGAVVSGGTMRLLASPVAIDHLSLPDVQNLSATLTLTDSAVQGPNGLSTSYFAPTSILRTSVTGLLGIGAAPVTIESSALDGGIRNTSGSSVTVTRSTLGRTAQNGLVTDNGSTTLVSSSTITGIQWAVDNGVNPSPSTSLTLSDTTVIGGTQGAIRWASGTVSATNSIISATAGGVACTPPAAGQLTSGGWNVATDGSCALTATGDLQNVDAGLNVLEANGGPTQTARPRSDSPAVDSGRPGCSGTDQRGSTRPQDGDGNGSALCDRGAVELDTYRSLSLVVDATGIEPDAVPGDGLCRIAASSACTLTAAIQEANHSNGPDTVTLAPETTYDFGYGGGSSWQAPDVTDPLVIQGSRSTVGGIRLRAVRTDLGLVSVNLSSANVAADASNLTVDRSTVSSSGFGSSSEGSITIIGGSHATVTHSAVTGLPSSSSGTAISTTSSDLVIDNTTISDVGTAVFDSASTVTITSSTISASSFGIVTSSGASATVANSVITRPVGNTTAIACSGGPMATVSQGWNLTFDWTCSFLEPTDLQNTDAKLGPLGVFGGSTPTRVPFAGSPAIDSGKPGCGTSDQRGRLRPVDGNADGVTACDRGAVEIQPATTLNLTVNSTADRVDTDLGDGVCATSAPVVCTLRAAIQEANATSGSDTVTLGTGATYALTRSVKGEDASTTGDLDILGSVVIHGNGSTLDAGGFESAVQILTGSVAMDHLSITGVSSDYGPAAIDSQATDLTFSDGTVTSAGDGLIDRGTGWMKIYRSTVTARLSVANHSTSSVIVTDTTLAGLGPNAGTGFEGGPGLSALVRTTISNRAVAVAYGTGLLTVQSSTITGNLYGLSTGSGGANVIDSTLVNNPYGSLLPTGGKITVTNSIVSSGGSTLCRPGTGSIVSLGWNLTSDTSCGFTQTGDVQGVAPLLGPLAMNGWYTATFLPSATSPAVGTGKPGCSGKDQRGLVRPSGGACDKGSVER